MAWPPGDVSQRIQSTASTTGANGDCTRRAAAARVENKMCAVGTGDDGGIHSGVVRSGIDRIANRGQRLVVAVDAQRRRNAARSEERRVGIECVSTGRSSW